jgi:hypothetical protein
MNVKELIRYLEQFDHSAEVYVERKDLPPAFSGKVVLLEDLPLEMGRTLKSYRVTYKEEPEDKFTFVFDCWAENSDHAIDQCEAAYPGCAVVNTTEM